MTPKPRILVEIEYNSAARAYQRTLKPENFAEAPCQTHQRGITLSSFDLIRARCPEVQVFNELLVQYPGPNNRKHQPQQVVPDTVVVLWPTPLKVEYSFILPLQPCGPFWVMDTVSMSNRRKDYEQNLRKYERDLKVPYYLLFVPEEEELTLYHHNGRKYVSVQPSEHGRYAVPQVEMEVGLLDGLVRYWHRGELMPLPADLQRDLEEATLRAEREAARADAATAENERLRKQIEAMRKRQKGD